MFKKLNLIVAGAVSVFAMNSAEINVNNSDLELNVKFDMGQFNENVEPATIFLGAKYLNGDEGHSDSRSIDDYGELNFLMMKDVSDNLKLGLGFKLNHTKNFTSVPLGAEVSYKLPLATVIPFYLGGSLYYASEVLCMEDGDSFLEFRVNLDAEVIENGRVTLGYRSLDTNYKVRDVEYNKSVYLGFKFSF
ncbi:YfaZ family outer membrane protein [Candidatus Sulfurimonas baltica]|uniref:Outer membrane protein beta-barrel domain-containing protein n=1 Tax=Candidatus Sulfurimonas baltica TaxID=2740404 RepID=A0A7S7RMD3_9BACT|nr:YfaZ family outer membrane protein [Candidatus Sulfurimonas baltica]QOY51434.1 hypothetical protein HUE88_09920 [Candidatus Sulfurimonas baltica]